MLRRCGGGRWIIGQVAHALRCLARLRDLSKDAPHSQQNEAWAKSGSPAWVLRMCRRRISFVVFWHWGHGIRAAVSGGGGASGGMFRTLGGTEARAGSPRDG